LCAPQDFIMPFPSRSGGHASLAIFYVGRPNASPDNLSRVATLRRAFRQSLTLVAVDGRGGLNGFQEMQNALVQDDHPPVGAANGGGCHLLLPVLGGEAGAELAISARAAFMEQGE